MIRARFRKKLARKVTHPISPKRSQRSPPASARTPVCWRGLTGCPDARGKPPSARRGIRRAMANPPAWPLLLLLVTPLGACTATKPNPASRVEWRKASDFAPSLEGARQDCKVQAAAETYGTHQGTTVVTADFVKCMRAAGWALVDHGAE